jgi:hypothetical protein
MKKSRFARTGFLGSGQRSRTLRASSHCFGYTDARLGKDSAV